MGANVESKDGFDGITHEINKTRPYHLNQIMNNL